MKNKASLTLMELLVMVLVFAMAAAGCLRCFLWAAQTSREIQLQDQAVTVARNAAQAMKATGGDEAATTALVTVPEGLVLKLHPLSPEIPGLEETEISVETDRGEVLFTLTAAWQEELP